MPRHQALIHSGILEKLWTFVPGDPHLLSMYSLLLIVIIISNENFLSLVRQQMLQKCHAMPLPFWGGVTKPISSVQLFSEFFNIVKTHVSYWISL